MPPRNDSVLLEDAKIIWRNFAGKEGQFNREGDRNFALLLPEDVADKLTEEGWNVKTTKSREEGDPEEPYISVTVGFGRGSRPPLVVMITSGHRTELDEEACGILDWVEIENVDLIINPYHWEVNGKSGIKAYLRSIFITIYEDPLQIKYRDVPEIATTVKHEEPRVLQGHVIRGELEA